MPAGHPKLIETMSGTVVVAVVPFMIKVKDMCEFPAQAAQVEVGFVEGAPHVRRLPSALLTADATDGPRYGEHR